jgi:O-antigen ligase
LIVCLAIALFIPLFGTMGWWPYNGAWRGIFWHKNQFGSIAALFNLVFLIGALNELPRKNSRFILYLVFYVFSLVLIYLSKSVAGYLLCISLTGLSLFAFLWLNVRHRLVKTHYYGLLGIGILALLLFLFNMDFIFGLFNRDTSLTGRLPMWSYLLNDVVPNSLWVGHGFGALWSQSAFRIQVQHAVGWEFPVAIGDNGFLDILLHVGAIGLTAFLGVLVTLFIRAVKLIRTQPSILSFFPLLLVIFAVLANITFSLFLETEAFLWLVMIAALFVTTEPQQAMKAS